TPHERRERALPAAVTQPARGHLAHAHLLGGTDRLERPAAASAGPTSLHLAEHEHPAVERDQVELAPTRAVVALDDRKAASLERFGGQPLAGGSESVPGVGAPRLTVSACPTVSAGPTVSAIVRVTAHRPRR